MHTLNSRSCRLSLRGGEGTTFSQLKACGRLEESARALKRVVGAVSMSRWWLASSIVAEKALCRSATLTCSSETQSGWDADWASDITEGSMWADSGMLWPTRRSLSGRECRDEPMKAAGAWSTVLRSPNPPLLHGREAFSHDPQSEIGPPRMPSRDLRMVESNSMALAWMCPGGPNVWPDHMQLKDNGVISYLWSIATWFTSW